MRIIKAIAVMILVDMLITEGFAVIDARWIAHHATRWIR